MRFKSIRELIKFLNSIMPNVPYYVAGGCLADIKKGNHINDIDIFFFNEKDYLEAVNIIDPIEERPTLSTDLNVNRFYSVIETKNALTLEYWTENPGLFRTLSYTSYKIQFIKKHFGSPEEVLSEFDLSTTKQYISFNSKEIHDKEQEKLHLHRNYSDVVRLDGEITSCTLSRFFKYIEKGYELDIENVIYIIDELYKRDTLIDYYSDEEVPVQEFLFDTLHRVQYLNIDIEDLFRIAEYITCTIINKNSIFDIINHERYLYIVHSTFSAFSTFSTLRNSEDKMYDVSKSNNTDDSDDNFLDNKVLHPTIELLLVLQDINNSLYIFPKYHNRVKERYPEFFI